MDESRRGEDAGAEENRTTTTAEKINLLEDFLGLFLQDGEWSVSLFFDKDGFLVQAVVHFLGLRFGMAENLRFWNKVTRTGFGCILLKSICGWGESVGGWVLTTGREARDNEYFGLWDDPQTQMNHLMCMDSLYFRWN